MILVKTPLRISFIGGGTDFPEHFEKNGGAVLGSAIDKFIYHNVSSLPTWLFEHKIRFSYRKVELVNNLDEIDHAPFREILRAHHIYEGIEVNLTSDLPAMTGLGSSSAFSVGLIKGLKAFSGLEITKSKLAETAINIERNLLHECVGFQDQIFAAYGGLNAIKFSGRDKFEVQQLPVSDHALNELNENLFLYFTGRKRRAHAIEVEKLKNVNLNEPMLLEMQSLVDQGVGCLIRGHDLDEFGNLLHQNWLLKRELSGGVSDGYIDDMYDMGIRNGAIGGKLLGAGGGGFMLYYVPLERHNEFRKAFSSFHEVKFNLNAAGSSVVYGQ